MTAIGAVDTSLTSQIETPKPVPHVDMPPSMKALDHPIQSATTKPETKPKVLYISFTLI